MHFCKKISLFAMLMSISMFAMAEHHHIAIKSADLSLVKDAYKLNADLDIEFGDTIEEAIDKGVSIELVYDFQLNKSRTFWFDKKVAEASTRIAVSYHALSRQYLVSQSGRQTSHEILSEAIVEFVQLYDWKVFDKTVIEAGSEYEATLNVKLDQTKLPKAIQVDAIGSETWELVAKEYKWLPKDLNPAAPE